jgi:hypothetical protein
VVAAAVVGDAADPRTSSVAHLEDNLRAGTLR